MKRRMPYCYRYLEVKHQNSGLINKTLDELLYVAEFVTELRVNWMFFFLLSRALQIEFVCRFPFSQPFLSCHLSIFPYRFSLFFL